MAVGAGVLMSGQSYVAVGREIALGTYNTCTAALDFLSFSVKTTLERKTIEQVERQRTYSKGISLTKKIEGDAEFYYCPRVDACNFILQNAFGGTVTSATATGETAGAGANSALTHTFAMGNMDQSYPSLCINQRKGDTAGISGSKIFQLSGGRVDEITFSADIDDALKCKTKLVFMDSTAVANDVAGALSVTDAPLLDFASGRLSVEPTFASLTSTSFWHIQSFELTLSNSLKKDKGSYRIGSRTLAVLPPGMAQFKFKCKMRFDTTTAFDAMIAATQLSAQLEFLGPTFTSSAIRQGIRFNMPKLFIANAGDPQIGGPDEELMSEVEFQVLRDDSSATGYALQALVTNQKANYA